MSDIVGRLRERYPQLEIDTDRLSVGWEAADEIERLQGIEQFVAEASRQERDGLRAEIERLRAREAQAKAIIRAAAVYVSHVGGWQATWHRDADKWLGNEHAGSKPC